MAGVFVGSTSCNPCYVISKAVGMVMDIFIVGLAPQMFAFKILFETTPQKRHRRHAEQLKVESASRMSRSYVRHG